MAGGEKIPAAIFVLKFVVKQFNTGKEVTIPIAAPLLEVLTEALAWKNSNIDYVCPNVADRYNKTNALGKNVGNNLVNIIGNYKCFSQNLGQ